MDVGQGRPPGPMITGPGGTVLYSSSPRLAEHLRLAAGRVLQALAETDQGLPGAVPDPVGGPLRYYLGLHVLLEVPHVRAHAAPDLEHLPFYALRNLAHYLN